MIQNNGRTLTQNRVFGWVAHHFPTMLGSAMESELCELLSGAVGYGKCRPAPSRADALSSVRSITAVPSAFFRDIRSNATLKRLCATYSPCSARRASTSTATTLRRIRQFVKTGSRFLATAR